MGTTPLLTLPQLAEAVDVEYRTLHSWVKRGLIAPSLQLSRGTGTPNIFSREDAVKIKVIADLRQAGIWFNVLAATLERLDEHPTALTDGAMVLVNGTVSVVDQAEATTAIAHGSLTLVYNVGHAIKMIETTLEDASRGQPGEPRLQPLA